jgi:hypothetical protein
MVYVEPRSWRGVLDTTLCDKFVSNQKETDIINMLKYLIDNIFVIIGGRVFQQTVGIPMGTNCAPLLTDLFLYLYEEHRFKLILNFVFVIVQT